VRISHIPLILAISVIVLTTLSFIAGYYWARHSLAEELMQLCCQEELSDLVAAACYANNGEELIQQEQEPDLLQQEHQEQHVDSTEVATEGAMVDTEIEVETAEENAEQIVTESATRRYQAILIGFGDIRNAEKYANKVAPLGIKTRIVQRVGKNKKGRTVTWYQVVTESMSYESLSAVVDRLKKTDRLEGVMIIEIEEEPMKGITS